MWPFKEKYKSQDVFEALQAYIDHVGCSEGVTFLSNSEKCFDPKHWEILQAAENKVNEAYKAGTQYVPNYVKRG